MSTQVIISIDQIKSAINDLESEVLLRFDEKKIDLFIGNIKEANTVYKLAQAVDVEELASMMDLIDVYYNSQRVTDKIKVIFANMESNFCVDYFNVMLENMEYTHE